MATRTSAGPVIVDSDTAAMLAPSLRRTTVDEYHRMIDAGILGEDDHVELLDGLIVTMSPQNPPHAILMRWLMELLVRALPPELCVRIQSPLTLGNSEPEPDIAVVARSSERADSHPTGARLVIEISGATIGRDRRVKRAIYAAAGVPEYVIAHVGKKQLEIWRDPVPAASSYRTEQVLTVADRFVSADVPGIAFDVADLFRTL